jgi:small-conductance mechanosensitive channel
MMGRQVTAWALMVCVAIFILPSHAQSVYRCDSAYGDASTGLQKCDANTSSMQDARTAQQKRQADQATRKIQAQANAMEKARLKQEAAILAQLKRDEKRLAQAKAREEKERIRQEKAAAKKDSERLKLTKPQGWVAKEPKTKK